MNHIRVERVTVLGEHFGILGNTTPRKTTNHYHRLITSSCDLALEQRVGRLSRRYLPRRVRHFRQTQCIFTRTELTRPLFFEPKTNEHLHCPNYTELNSENAQKKKSRTLAYANWGGRVGVLCFAFALPTPATD